MSNPGKQNKSIGIAGIGGSKQSLIRSAGQGRSKGGSLIVGSKAKKVKAAPKKTVRVLDAYGVDVTPRPLYQAEPGDAQTKHTTFCLDELFSSRQSSFLSSSTLSSQCTITSQPPPVHQAFHPPVKETVTMEYPNQQMMDEKTFMSAENIYICFTETDTISLLEFSPTMVSQDDEAAEAVKESNSRLAELCKAKLNPDKYVGRSTQTLNDAPKIQSVQTEKAVMVDTDTMATIWNIYDSFHPVNETSGSANAHPGTTTANSKDIQKRGESGSHDPDEPIVLSESFQQILLSMERTVIANIFQPILAAYRQLPIVEDPDSTEEPAQNDTEKENKTRPTLEPLWAFSCELTKGWAINSMTWNKKNPDILAVGYGRCNLKNATTAGLICCWTLKNPTWPERVFYCHSCVTSLDFSTNNPNQLGVGMLDGTVAIYNVCVQGSDSEQCIIDSRKCPQKHMSPISQVSWTEEEMKTLGEAQAEALVSVCTDGKVKKWFFCSDGFDSRDLMELKQIPKKGNNKKFTENISSVNLSVLQFVTSGICFSFHPSDSSVYLIGTGEGHIHKCSVTNRYHYLKTYNKHFGAVNHIDRSPFCPDVFLSCSYDWTIQLWKEKIRTPILGFSSSQGSVTTVKWSPHWPDVFTALNGKQAEVWVLNSDILDPIIVHHAPPGVTFTSLLFAKNTDCLLIGDSVGKVTIYQLKNLHGDNEQVATLQDIIHSAVSP